MDPVPQGKMHKDQIPFQSKVSHFIHALPLFVLSSKVTIMLTAIEKSGD